MEKDIYFEIMNKFGNTRSKAEKMRIRYQRLALYKKIQNYLMLYLGNLEVRELK